MSELELDKAVFGLPWNADLVHLAVRVISANQRQVLASTKMRGEVSGGGKKPWAQKGTGRARAGSSRSPLWKKGGIAFGPKPRDFSFDVPRKVRIAALRESLNAKFLSNDLVCVDEVSVPSGKTRDFSKILADVKAQGRVLVVMDGVDAKTLLAGRNLARVTLSRASDVNALDIMNNKMLLVTKTAMQTLLKRIQ